MSDKNSSNEVLGFVAPNVGAIAIIALTNYLCVHVGVADGFYYSEVIIIPMLMGLTSAWYWRNLGLSSRRKWGYCFLNCLISAMLAFLFYMRGLYAYL